MAPTLTEQLGTITAIVALALGVVQVLKMLLVKYRVGIVNSLPTPLICVGVSMGLTVLASLVLKTLPGDIFDLLWQAALAAGAASGFFSWAKEPMDSPENKSARTPLFLLLGLSLALTSGCGGMSNGQKYKIACNTYETTMKVMVDLRTAGYLTTADRVKVTELSNIADAYLDQMERDVIAGRAMNFPYLMEKVNGLLDELLRLQIQAEALKKAKAGKTVGYGGRNTIDDERYDEGGNHHRQGSGAGFGLAVGTDSRSPGDGPGVDGRRNRALHGGPQGGQGDVGRWRTPCPAVVMAGPEIEWD